MVKVYHSIPCMSTIFCILTYFLISPLVFSHFTPIHIILKNVDKPFLSCYNFYSSFMMSYKIK